MTKKLRLEGFPTACNKVKASLFIKKVASDHDIPLTKIDYNGTYAELTFVKESDIDTYVNNLTQFFFGGKHHVLKTLILIEPQHDRNDSTLTSIQSSMPTPSLPARPSAWESGQPYESSENFNETMPSLFSSMSPTTVQSFTDTQKDSVPYSPREHHFHQKSLDRPWGNHTIPALSETFASIALQSTAETSEEEKFFDSVCEELPPTVVDFSRAHTWFDLMDDLLTEQNQIALLIQLQNTDTGHAEIQEYFESRESGGGPVKKIILMIDGVLITFHHKKTAENVLQKKVHEIGGNRIRLFQKIIPEVFRDKIILKNSTASSLSEDEKLMKIGNISTDLPEPNKIEPSEVECISEVSYEVALGEKELLSLFESAKAVEVDEDFQILALPKTDCILVENLPKEIDLKKLKVYLENKAFSGGAIVTRMDRSSLGSVVVYFTSYKDVEDVLNRYGESGMNIFDKRLLVKPYYHCLSHLHKKLEENHKLDDFSKKMLDKEVAPMSFEFSDVKTDVVKFVSSRTRFFQELKDKLKDLACVDPVQSSTVLKVTPISVQVSKDQVEFKNNCIPILQTFFARFVSKEQCNFNLENLGKVRQAKVHRNLLPNGVDEEENDYAIRWTGTKDETLVVTGLVTSVDSTIEKIVSLADISSQTLPMNPGKYRWLVAIGSFVKLMGSNSCMIKQNDEKFTLSFTGAKHAISNAHLEILKMIEPLKREKFDSLDKNQERFLTDPKLAKRIVNYVNPSLKDLGATLSMEDNAAYIWCHEDKISNAVIKLRKMLVTDKSTQLTPEQSDAMKVAEWEANYNMLTMKHLVEITITNLSIIIVGFRDQIEAAKSLISAHLDKHTVVTERFPMTYGKALFVKEFCTEFRSCENLEERRFEHGAFLVKGKKSPVEKALGILKKQKIVEDKATWEFCKILEYFVSGKGKQAIADAKSDFKCIVLLEEDIPIMDESPPDSPIVERASNVTKQQEREPGCEVLSGDITLNQCDAIVNPIGKHFNLQKGGLVCSAILRKGGDIIDAELKKAKGKFIRVTTSGKLPSRAIIHADFTNDPYTMRRHLKEVLQIAEEKRFQTIGIPAVGTGNMHMPPSDIAQLMYNAFEDFKTSTKVKILQKIEVVIFDQRVLPAFKEVFSRSGSDSSYNQLHASSDNGSLGVPLVVSSPAESSNKKLVQNTTTIGPFKVHVKRGDITQENYDAIVNSCSHNFDLTKGQVSKQILKKGGNGIQKELTAASGKVMRVTRGGNLPCGKIIHVNFPNTGDKMKSCIEDILQKSEDEKISTLALPAIGTGNLALPSAEIAKLVREAIEHFSSNNPTALHLNEIAVVVFDEPKLHDFLREIISVKMDVASAVDVGPILNPSEPKDNTTTSFYQKMRTMVSTPMPVKKISASSSLSRNADQHQNTSGNSIMMGSIKLSVTKGDITAQTTDGIVNSTGTTFSLQNGQVSTIIVRKGGDGIQNELSAAIGTHIRVTSGGNLACSKIIHAIFNGDEIQMKQRVIDVLAKADAEKLQTLSFPAIGTGNLNLPSSRIAKVIQEALTEFTSNTMAKYLKEVNLVIFDSSKHSDFLRELITVPKRLSSGAIPKKMPEQSLDATNTPEEIGDQARASPASLLNSPDIARKKLRFHAETDTVSSDDDNDFEMNESNTGPQVGSYTHLRQRVTRKRMPVVSKPRDPDSITVCFYGVKKDKVKKAKAAIDRHIAALFEERTCVIAKLDDICAWKANALAEILSRSNVKHNIDVSAKTVKLSGKIDAVTDTKNRIEQLGKELETYDEFHSFASFSWKYLDSNKKWVNFPPVGNNRTERAYVKKKKTTDRIILNINGENVSFVANVERNILQSVDPKFNYQFKIRREMRVETPACWDNMDDDEDFKQVKLDQSSPEFSDIEKRIKKTVPTCRIESISRIQNRTIYSRYFHELTRVKKISSSQEIERTLFHATKEDIGDKIAHEGFDRGYCGENAVAFGNGTYFARDASYSNKPKFARPNKQNIKTMIVAKVITGDYVQGKPGMKSAPAKTIGGTELYNSAVNNLKDPIIFVIFVDAGAYPEYMVKYTG